MNTLRLVLLQGIMLDLLGGQVLVTFINLEDNIDIEDVLFGIYY